jgi:hypothetical protein
LPLDDPDCAASWCCDDQLNPPWLPRSQCTIVPAGDRRAIVLRDGSKAGVSVFWGEGLRQGPASTGKVTAVASTGP